MLLAYRAMPYASSGMSPLTYCMVEIPNYQEFKIPIARYPVMETEGDEELARELKQACSVAK